MSVTWSGGFLTKATVLSKVTVSPIPALAKSDIASFTTDGVHTTLVLEEAHALRLETVQTGPGKLTI